MAVKNKGEKAGGNQVVLGQVVCLPEETGPDFIGSVCEVTDARSRSLFHEGFLTVVWGTEGRREAGRAGGQSMSLEKGARELLEIDLAGLGEGCSGGR